VLEEARVVSEIFLRFFFCSGVEDAAVEKLLDDAIHAGSDEGGVIDAIHRTRVFAERGGK